jgi:YihY family inner membrane protein
LKWKLGDQLREEAALFIEARLDRLRRHPILGEIYEFYLGTVDEYFRGHGLMYAGGVAFYAILSLIPLLVLFASAAGYAMHYWGGDTPAEMDQLIADVMMQMRRAIPYLNQTFEEDLRRIIDNRGGLGIFSAAALLLTASQVFRALEYSFAHIFSTVNPEPEQPERRRRTPRNVVLSKLVFGAFIAALVVGFLAVRFFVSLLQTVVEHLPTVVADVVEPSLHGDSMLAAAVEVFVVVGGFGIILKSFTRTRVRLRFAFVGGMVFFLMWQAARLVYEYYLDRWSDLGALYGSFTTIMVAVIWVFYTSTLLLFCGHVVKTVQRRFVHGPRWPKEW